MEASYYRFHLGSQSQGHTAIGAIHQEVIVGAHTVNDAQAIVLGVRAGEIVGSLHVSDEKVRVGYRFPVSAEVGHAVVGL